MNASAAPVAGIEDVGRPGLTIPAMSRAIARTSAFIFFSLVALAEISLTIPFVGKERRAAARAIWLHRWCRFACSVLGMNKTVAGKIPVSGLLVCNHLSYLDIVLLSSTRPCVFVAKKDVAAWPLFGWLARAAGTIFADRSRRAASRQTVDLIKSTINSGALVVLFPEGTSSDGRSVLPFKSALLEPALQAHCAVHAAAIEYALPHGGSVADEVCYWREMTLVPHLLNLFSKRQIDSKLSIGKAECCCNSRKQLACELRRQIIEMRS